MTPSQQTALSNLVGRALTQGEVEQIDGLRAGTESQPTGAR